MFDFRNTSKSLFLILCLAGVWLLPQEALGAGKEPKKRIAVADFVNEARYSQYKFGESGDIGGGMAEKLVDQLMSTGKFVVLERETLSDVLAEQNLDNIAHVEPAVIGRLTSAQALIRGVITNIDAGGSEKGGFKLGKFRIKGKNQRVTIKINLRIIDTTTGQIIESRTVEGIAKVRGVQIRDEKDRGTNLDLRRGKQLSKALDDAIYQAVDQIVAGMGKIPWQGSISRVSGRQIIINAGYQENVEPGLQLRVFEKGADIIDKESNEDLGRLDEEIGVIQVVRVEPRFSVAKVVRGQGFSEGNIIRPWVGAALVLEAEATVGSGSD